METIKNQLPESEVPKFWYNIAADLPQPPPPVLHPGTGQPVGPEDLAPLFPMGIITRLQTCLLYTSPSPRDRTRSRMPSSA